MIRINITGPNATVTQTETLTAGRVGLECAFSFDSAWDGLNKIAVCEGADTKGVVMETGNDTIVIPWECLADPGYKLRIGVRGENALGDIVIPTVWARVGKISDSPGDDIDPGQEATPSVVQQIQETAANALYIARGVKEEADSGAFDGEKGEKGDTGDSGVYIGESQPTNPDVGVWIDTTGDADIEIHNVPAGGTSGQVLAKASGTDYDLEWTDQTGGSTITVDPSLSDSSTNPVQNKAVKAGLEKIQVQLWVTPGGGWYGFTTIDATGNDVPVCFPNIGTNTGLIDPIVLPLATQSAKGAMSASDKTKLDGIDMSAKLNANQGAANAGKFMVVGSDGTVAPVTMTAWQGGNY